jgi:hypothetical protein
LDPSGGVQLAQLVNLVERVASNLKLCPAEPDTALRRRLRAPASFPHRLGVAAAARPKSMALSISMPVGSAAASLKIVPPKRLAAPGIGRVSIDSRPFERQVS